MRARARVYPPCCRRRAATRAIDSYRFCHPSPPPSPSRAILVLYEARSGDSRERDIPCVGTVAVNREISLSVVISHTPRAGKATLSPSHLYRRALAILRSPCRASGNFAPRAAAAAAELFIGLSSRNVTSEALLRIYRLARRRRGSSYIRRLII